MCNKFCIRDICPSEGRRWCWDGLGARCVAEIGGGLVAHAKAYLTASLRARILERCSCLMHLLMYDFEDEDADLRSALGSLIDFTLHARVTHGGASIILREQQGPEQNGIWNHKLRTIVATWKCPQMSQFLVEAQPRPPPSPPPRPLLPPPPLPPPPCRDRLEDRPQKEVTAQVW